MRKASSGVDLHDREIFGEDITTVERKSNAGRLRAQLRTMIPLRYLKHALNESDEDVVEQWGKQPKWVFFTGQAYFGHNRPCRAATPVNFYCVILAPTVHHKAIDLPTNRSLPETARRTLVEGAKDASFELKTTYDKEAPAQSQGGALRTCPPVSGHAKSHEKPAYGARSAAARDLAQVIHPQCVSLAVHKALQITSARVNVVQSARQKAGTRCPNSTDYLPRALLCQQCCSNKAMNGLKLPQLKIVGA